VGGCGAFGGLGGQGVFLKGSQLRGTTLDGGLGLGRAGSVEVVTGGDLGQPALEAVEVGLGLLDLGVGGPAAGPFPVQLDQELGNALQQVGVFDSPFAAEVLDDGLFLGRGGGGDLE